ncbi:MAG: sulfite exporter TauE/SafE family protein [Anaerolineales bacterium]|jgi:uncharacterized membrane protein YfcA
MSFLTLISISSLAGLVGALGGMGGGTLLIPAFTFLGMDIKHAIAISMVSVIATSSGAAAAYVRDRLTNLRAGMFLEIFTILGAIAGASLTIAMPRQPLFIAFGVILILSWGASTWRRRKETPAMTAAVDRFTATLGLRGSYFDLAEQSEVEYQPVRAAYAGPLMLLVGAAAGLFGVGAGALKVLVLEQIMGLPTKVATSTSNLIIGVTALAGSSVYLAAGLIDPGTTAPVILGVLSGAFLGTRLLNRLSNRSAQRVFLLILLILGVAMILRGMTNT